MRKQKVGVRIMALALVLGMSCAVVACGGDGEDSGSTPPTVFVPKTDEEIFAVVKEADINSRAYDGAYTVKLSSTSSLHPYGKKVEQIASGDIEKRRFAGKVFAIDENNQKQPIQEVKWFQSSNKDYWYTSDYETPQCYTSETEGVNAVLGGRPSEAVAGIVSLTLADSFAELVQAYETVTEESIERLQATCSTISGDTEITALHDNGESTVRISSRAEAIAKNQTPIFYSTTYFFSAKDGMISNISVKDERNFTYLGNEISQTEEIEISYTYAFDEALYNSIIPCAETEQEQTQGYIGINFVCQNGCSVYGGTSFRETATAQELFEAAKEYAFERAVYLAPTPAYTVEGWYLDEAYTQLFDPMNMTARDLLTIDKLYAKDFTLAGDRIFIASEERLERTDKRSKPYKIVEKNGFPRGRGIMDSQLRALYTEERQKTWDLPRYDYDEVYLNGELTTETSVLLEGGKWYNVEYVRAYKDSDFNLFSNLDEILYLLDE